MARVYRERVKRDVPEEHREAPRARSATPHAVLALQRGAGNRAVSAMLARGGGDGAFTGKGQTIGGQDPPDRDDHEEIHRRREARRPEYQRELAEARAVAGTKPPVPKVQRPGPSGQPRPQVMTLDDLLGRSGSGGGGGASGGPGFLESRSGGTVTLTETKDSGHEGASSKPPDSAPAQVVGPQDITAKLIALYRKDLATGGAWGSEAELAVFAALFNVTFMVAHHAPGEDPYIAKVGSGSNVLHLHHNGIHYDVLQVVGNGYKLIAVPGDGACLFAAAWLALTGQRADAKLLATLRRLIAANLTDEQIIATLANIEAAQGAELLGVGPGVMAALHPPATGAEKKPQAAPLTPEQRKEQAGKAASAAEQRAQQGQTVQDTVASEPKAEPDADRSMEERRGRAAQAALAAKQRHRPLTPATARPKELDMLEEAREAKTAATADWVRVRNLQPAAPKTLTGEHADALTEARDAKTAASVEYGKRPKPAAAPSAPLPKTLDLFYSFGAEEAEELVSSHLPDHDIDVYTLLDVIPEDALSEVGFDWQQPHHAALVKAAVQKLQAERALARAERERAAHAALIQRKAKYNPNNADTWQMNPLQFHTSAVTPDAVAKAQDAAGILTSIQKGFVVGNGPKSARLPATVGPTFHTHLQSGTWGLAYMFVLEADFTVTPWVIDIATSRTKTNMYYWKAGTGFTPPKPDVPPKPD
jgi:hypothetical protein